MVRALREVASEAGFERSQEMPETAQQLLRLLGETQEFDAGQTAALCHQLAADPEGRSLLLAGFDHALNSAELEANVLRLLHHVRLHPEPSSALRVVRATLKTSAIDDYVDLLLLPSIFEPEDWSFTFLEGLLRLPSDTYARRTLVELGAGSGFVSLALLRTTPLRRAVAVELNPVAVSVARINARLNSYDDELRPRRDRGKRLLWERFSIEQSDLLRSLLARGRQFDLVVGCIPQVLAPGSVLDRERALARLDERELYELSNYFVLQGVYEDQFGLGLLARALEQAARVLKRNGRVMLNIAGRPGSRVIQAMFQRRGYSVRDIWSRRVAQAADTDIAVLAELEEKTGQLFEFFVHPQSRQPVGARTALAVQQAQHVIWHDLRVLDAEFRYERDLLPFFDAIYRLDYAKFLDQIDLSAISAEQVGFLRRLAEYFVGGKLAPYTDEQGSERWRGLLVRYLDLHFGMRTQPSEVFIGPSRQVLLVGLLKCLCASGDRVLLSERSFAVYQASAEEAAVTCLRGNDELSELGELVRLLKPKLAVVAPSAAQRPELASLRGFCEVAGKSGTVVVIDGSDLFDITSSVHTNAVLEFAASELPSHVLVLTGLTKNRVYPELQPAFLLGAAHELRRGLCAFAESSYSRINCFTELYYERLFEEILSFQLARAERRRDSLAPPDRLVPALSSRAEQLLNRPAFATPSRAHDPSLEIIRLDYGENELAMPDRLVQGILLGFTNLGNESPAGRVAELLSAWYAGNEGEAADPRSFVLGPGVSSLTYCVALALKDRLGRAPRVAIAEGHYGYLPATFELAGSTVIPVTSGAELGFALTRTALEAAGEPPDLLLVVNPHNPAGVFWNDELLQDLVAYADEHQCWILSDEIFSGLDLTDEDVSGVRARPARLAELVRGRRVSERLIRLDGLSKRFAAGGLRVGWLQCRDRDLVSAIERLAALHPIERHARVATEVFFGGFVGGASGRQHWLAELAEYETAMRRKLRERRRRLATVWERAGARLPRGRPAGLFVFPDVRSLYGRRVTLADGSEHVIDEANLCGLLLTSFGLRVNSGSWAGTAGHVRCCFAINDQRFEMALGRLEQFVSRLHD